MANAIQIQVAYGTSFVLELPELRIAIIKALTGCNVCIPELSLTICGMLHVGNIFTSVENEV